MSARRSRDIAAQRSCNVVGETMEASEVDLNKKLTRLSRREEARANAAERALDNVHLPPPVIRLRL